MMAIRLLAVDVDGTLVHQGNLLEQDVHWLRRACEAGIIVSLCTGRAWNEVKPVWERLRLPGAAAPVICVGGALVVEPTTGRSLYARPFSRPTAQRLAQSMRDMGYPVLALVDAWREGFDYYVLGGYSDRPLYAKFVDGRGLQLHPLDKLDDRTARPLRLNVLDQPPRARQTCERLREQFGQEIEVQSIHLPNYGLDIVEAFAPGATKYSAMQYVAQGFGLGASVLAAIGDDHNDVPMLRHAARSAAPADAPPEVLAVAKKVYANRGQGAVAQFIQDILA